MVRETETVKYDYIVIGAGSAGCVVAGRLAEKGNSVLLLEAGGSDSNPLIHIPLGYSLLYDSPKVNWCYESEEEPYLNNRRLFQPRGKVLGGTGSINGMIYMRGQPQDFDDWKHEGCEGWGWDDVLPFFKSCEDQERGADAFHGVGGPVAVSDIGEKYALGEAFQTASEALGVSRNVDFNSDQQFGTGYVQTTTKNGRRWSTATGYLRGEAKRNIDIKLNAHVHLLELESGRVKTVKWHNFSGDHKAHARFEVILSAGTFNSPQILQLSGVGPAKTLKAHGVEVKHALRGVGENLQDHFGVGAEYKSKGALTVNDLYNNKLKGGWHLLRYLLTRKGPFADNGNYCNSFICSNPLINRPDMMVTFMAWCTNEQLKPHAFSGFTILAEHMRPQSRGHVRIKSNDPYDTPSIQFNFFKDDSDQSAAIAGLRFGRKIAETAPLKTYVVEEINPGVHLKNDDELRAYCRKAGLSLLHPVGTCKMGTGKDAVVDARLKVHGIENLRVVDASIMPRIVTGNTNAAAIMIGEKGAHMILEDQKL